MALRFPTSRVTALSTAVLVMAAHACATVTTYCVKECVGLPDRDYNSCGGCGEYITCFKGFLTKRSCVGRTFFDTVKGTCDWKSDTCTEIDSSGTIQSFFDETTTREPKTTNREATTVEQLNLNTTGASQTSSSDEPTTEESTAAQINQNSTGDGQTSSFDPPTERAPTAGQIREKTFRFKRVLYETAPCLTTASEFRIDTVRSKLDCAVSCHHTSNCWYFLYKPPQCLQFNITSPPCFIDIYKYDG